MLEKKTQKNVIQIGHKFLFIQNINKWRFVIGKNKCITEPNKS